MTYRIVLAATVRDDFAAFASYAADYSEDFAREQFVRLNRILSLDIAASPNLWSYFYVTGAPYRAYLFRVGRRTAYWIVYTVDDAARCVNVVRFWNASANPITFGV